MITVVSFIARAQLAKIWSAILRGSSSGVTWLSFGRLTV